MEDLEHKVKEENNESSKSSDNYEFVTETIKKRPVNTRKILKKLAFTILAAVIFGLVASVTFIFVYPRLQEHFFPEDDTKPVSLPVARDDNEEAVEEFVQPSEEGAEETADNEAGDSADTDTAQVISDADHNDETSDAAVSDDEDANTSDTAAEGREEAGTGETNDAAEENAAAPDSDEASDDGVVINQVVEKTVEKSLETDDYWNLLRKISSIAKTAQKSLVTVSGRTTNTDWFNNSYENNLSSSGVIVADNGKELLVVAPTKVLHAATNVDVTFDNGTVCTATIRLSDANTGLSVVAVKLDVIDEDTLDDIEMAQFGSVAADGSGTPVLAVGAPYGTKGSVAMGQITSNSIVVDKEDTNLTILSTDIYGSTQASGVLVNYNGRIVGIICHEDVTADMPNLINAYSITDITETIEKISNGKKIACLGIIGTDVTEEAMNNYSVPQGAYVKEVVVDSPAMTAGIRNGDVIVKMGTKDIGSFEDYKSVINDSSPGDTIVVDLLRPIGNDYTELTYEVTLEELK